MWHVSVWAGKVNFGLSFHVLSALALDVILFLSVERQQFSKSEEIVLVIFLTLTNRTLNWLGFGVLKPVGTAMFWLYCWFIVPVATNSSVFLCIRSNIVWNRWKISMKVCRNQRRTNYDNTVYFVHQGKSRKILESVARSLFTPTITRHMIGNVCLYLSSL